MSPSTLLARRGVAALGAAALLGPCGYLAAAQASTPKATARTVKLSGMQFSPRSVTVSKGQSVRFVWAGGSHDLSGPGVKTDVVSSGSRTVTFHAGGTHTYVCHVHRGMSMTVKVR